MSKLEHVVPPLTAAALLALACSCSSLDGWFEAKPPPPEAVATPAPTVVAEPAKPLVPGLEQADKLLDLALEGAKLRDYKRYSRNFSDAMKLACPDAVFQEECIRRSEALGDYVSRSFLGELAKGARRHYLWKARFSKTDDDILIRMVVEGEGDKAQVANLNIR